MTDRRRFLICLAAAGFAPGPSWSDVGRPDFISAARAPDGTFHLAGLTQSGQITFSIPLAGRGHAAAAHPLRAEAVAFARRPGNFAVVMDCVSGRPIAELTAPKGRHFYGHGAFSADGDVLYTTENDFEAGAGVIGVWDAKRGYKRLREFASQGVGPHEMMLLPEGRGLVVANGGIETHPDTGRAKLNIPTMRPNLAYFDLDGGVHEIIELDERLHKNSIRHLAVRPDGLVAFAMQWQGEASAHPPLLGLHRAGSDVQLIQADPETHRVLKGYAGSVAISKDGQQVAITSPRGGVMHWFNLEHGTFSGKFAAPDVCGVGAADLGFIYTTGTGTVGTLGQAPVSTQLQWDNHLVPLRACC